MTTYFCNSFSHLIEQITMLADDTSLIDGHMYPHSAFSLL